jgi:hypothetical protein
MSMRVALWVDDVRYLTIMVAHYFLDFPRISQQCTSGGAIWRT